MNDVEILDWLMDGDPAIRWQVLRDLQGADPEAVVSQRRRVALEGWGAALLAFQDPSGTWAGGIYTPKWTSTTYTLLLLRSLGLPPDHPAAQGGLARLLDAGNFSTGGVIWSRSLKHSDLCVDAMLLALMVYFDCPDERGQGLVKHLLAHQMDDGGWNCKWVTGASHSSFHTTLSVLEGLLEYECSPFHRLEVAAAARRGEAFLLQHHLFRSHRTGQVVDPRMLRFSFPPRWRYDVLRVLDYFQAAARPYDARMQDALDLLREKRLPDGRWKLENRHPGRIFFDLEAVGQPSRWNTLRALRVLQAYGHPSANAAAG